MATFELTAPDGSKYQVDASDEHSAVAALQNLNARPPQRVTDPATLAQLNSAPVRIGAPDGSTVEFPAGTSDDTIKSAMAKAYPAPKRTLNINGHNVAVDDSFFKLSPDEQNSTVDEIAKSLPKQVTDPAVLAQLNAPEQPKSKTILERADDIVRSLANGMTLGLADRIAASMGSATGVGGKSGDYAGNLAREQAKTDQFASEHPIGNAAAQTVGTIATLPLTPLGALATAGKGVGLGTKMLVGTGTGGVIGGVQGALGSKDWTDLPQVGKDAAIGSIIGAVTGGAVPAAGKAIGAGYNAAVNAVRGRVDGMSRTAGNHLVNAVAADGPEAVRQRLQELGPDAMLADGGAALLGKAQGASLNSDEGRSVLQGALTTRNNATNARIQSDVNRTLGPAEDPQGLVDSILARRRELDSSAYPMALDNAPKVTIAPIMTDLADRIGQAPQGSMEQKALSNLQTMLTKKVKEPLLDAEGYSQYDKLGNERFKDVPYSHDDANILHKVKQELDNVIEYDQPGLGVPAGALSRQQTALKQMRFQINDALETQVPGYKMANETSAMLARRAEAVKNGTQYLGSGKTTSSPTYFAKGYSELSPDEMIAFQKGSNGEINRLLGTKANDLQALRTELQGEGGWNTAKLATVHGQPTADELVNSVDRNLAFRNTYNKVVENSQTAQRQAAASAMKPTPATETPLVNPNMSVTGLLATGAKKAANAAINAVRPDATRRYGEVARVLSETGAARDARVQSIIDALNKRQATAAASPQVGNTAALLSALAANSYARSGGRKRTQQTP